MNKPQQLRFDITGAELPLALRIAFETKVFGFSRVKSWSQDGNRLVLHWYPDPEATTLPQPMEYEAALKFVQSWLDEADYGPEPDTDGSTCRSCRVYNEEYGRVGGNVYAFVAIEPAWLVYGK